MASVAVSFLALLHATNGSLLGIDLGHQFFKVALVKPGTPFEIVTNVHTKRKTQSIVGFDNGERLFGGDAKTLSGRRPHLVFDGVRRLLGRGMDHPAVATMEKRYVGYGVQGDDERKTIRMSYEANGNKTTFSAEEVAAMTLMHGRANAEAFANEKDIKDVVLTVPSFYTQAERQAYLDAAKVAGFKVLSLIEENTAAALQYGLDRIFTEEKEHTMLVFNMGSASTQVSVFEYGHYTDKKNKTFGQFTAIGKGWDENLGGEDWEMLLVERMADEFDEQRKKKGEIRKILRPMARMKQTAEKVKKVLSANQKFPITIQSLHEDKDFRSMVTREEFETMAKGLFERVLTPVKDALTMANLTAAEIDQVEIIGGGVRVPKIQAMLKEFFDVKELGVHLNGDEAVVLGAAFRAANISKAFRVGRVGRSVGMVDVTPFPMGVRLKNAPKEEAEEAAEAEEKEWNKRVQLFKRKSQIGKRRLIKFQHDKDITCAMQYDPHSQFPDHASADLGGYHITGIEAFANGPLKHLGKPKVILSFFLDDNGILKLQKAEATLEEMVMPEPEPEKKEEEGEEKKEEAAEEKKEEATGEKKEEAAEEKKEGEEKKEDKDAKEGDVASNETETEEAPKPKKKVHRRVLSFKFIQPSSEKSVASMSKTDFESSRATIRALDEADAERKLRDGLKNDLESYVFSTRSKIREAEEEVSKVSTEEEREKIMEDLEGIEDWLYEDGEEGGANAPVDAYKQKRKKMDDRVNAIFFRLAELEARPKAIEAARAILEAAKTKVEEWKTARPQITEEDIKTTTLMVDEIAKWLEEKETKQAELDTTADPVFSSLDVKKQIRPLSRLVARMLSKKLPKPAAPNATEANATATATDEEQKENADADESEDADKEKKDDDEEQSTEL